MIPKKAAYANFPGAFRCNGTNDYAEINFNSAATVCTTAPEDAVTIHAAINVCVKLNKTGVNLNVYCNGPLAELQYFAAVDVTCSTYLAVTYNATDTCKYMFPFSTDTLIYGDISNCTQGTWPTQVTTTTGTTSSSSDGSIINYAIALIITLIAVIFV